MKSGLALLAVMTCLAAGCGKSETKLTLEQAFQKAQEHDARQEYDQALKYYTIALEHDPKNYVLLNNRAAVYASMKDYEKSFLDLSKAIEYGGDKFALPYIHRSALYFHSNQLDKALADINKAIAIDPKHAEAHWIRGVIYTAQNKDRQGEAERQKALQLGFKPQQQPAAQ